MMIAALVMGILSTLGTAYGAYSQSQAQKQAAGTAKKNAEYQEAQAQINAKQAEMVAENKSKREEFQRAGERKEQKRKAKRVRSIMEAGYAKSGILLDGTPSAYLVDQAGTDELNVQRADQVSDEKKKGFFYEGDVQAFSALKTGAENAANYRNKSKALLQASKTSLISGAFESIGSGISTYNKASKLSFFQPDNK